MVATGREVKTLRVGDAVYGMAFGHPMDYSAPPGYCSEYAVGSEDLFLPKPAHVAFEDAAALLGNVLTGVLSIDLGLRRMLMRAGGQRERGLEGKTAFVPGALSATGSVGVQLLKHVYGAARVVSTASAAKVPLVARCLPAGTVDRVVDYTAARRLADAVEPGSVDFVYNTQWGLEGTLPLLNRDAGVVVSIASVPPPSVLLRMLRTPPPLWLRWATGLVQW